MDYIKLSRKLLEWEWYTDVNTCRLFIHMLLKANWKDGRFQGADVPRGSFVSSISRLALETGLSEMQVRTALKHLKATGEVTGCQQAKFTVFTVNNYNKYQADNRVITEVQQPCNREVTGEQQADNTRVTTIEEKKEVKKGRMEEGKKVDHMSSCTSADPCNREVTGEQQADNTRVTTIEEKKEVKKGRMEEGKKVDHMSSCTSADRTPEYPYKAVIDYLNTKMGTSYRASSKDTQKHIRARFQEGYTLIDFEKVIDKKVREWKGTEFEKFLRPSTLFGSKFENYLNQTGRIGHAEGNFEKVIDKKVREWKGTEFEKFLRPSTLFGSKFENYLNQTGRIGHAEGNKFNNFQPRDYDFPDMEKALLGANMQ